MRRLFWCLLLVFALSACGELVQVPPTHDPSVPRTATATDNVTGLLRVQFPGDWLSANPNDSTLTLSNSGAAIRNYGDDVTRLQPGQIIGTVSALAKDALPDTVADSARGVANYVIGTITAAGDGPLRYTFGSIEALQLGEQALVRSDGLGTSENLALEVRVMVVDTEAAYGILFFTTRLDELQQYTPQMDMVAQSFTFFTAQAVRATQTAVADD